MKFEDLERCGYDEEERYFHERDSELLAIKRAELDDARARKERERARQAHWMKCPKCGGDLCGVRIGHVIVDRCSGCDGIYLDRGELELLQHVHHETLLEHLRRVLHLGRAAPRAE